MQEEICQNLADKFPETELATAMELQVKFLNESLQHPETKNDEMMQ